MSERDRLDELGAELPWDRPDDARRTAVRSSLLTAAAETSRRRSIGRWFVVGGAFACGAAAAVVAVALWPRAARDDGQLARVEASPAARLEDTVTRTATGSDETVRVHGGRVRLAVGELRRGDRVRVATGDAVVEGVGSYEVSVANDELSEVTVQSGTAEIHVTGHQAVFLATGQTWRASVVTADLAPSPPKANGTATGPGGVASNSPTSLDSSATVGAPATPDSPPTASLPSPAPASMASNATGSNVTASSALPSNATSSSTTLSNASSSNAISKATPSTTTSSTSKATPSITTSSNATSSNATSSNATSSKAISQNTSSTSPATKSPTTSTTNTSANRTTSSTIDPLDEPLPTATRPAISTGASSTTSTTSATRLKSPTEQHLQVGWELLRAGKAAEAANELGKAADGEGDLAVDARYFQSIALIRAGRSADAERALVGFLDHAPKSIRHGRASVMLARLLAARGDAKSARAWFESALHDQDPSVVAAARDGLAALHGN